VLRDALAAISADLSSIDGRPPPDALVAMGGAVTNLTAVKLGLATYDPDAVQGATLDRAEIDRQIERYRARDADARRATVGLQPKRADVILAGASSGPSWRSWAGDADRERPGPPPGTADRPVRRLTL
jgi:exopolyphosphatase/guanosine-5'-triphosphate,3'-diphosphate pyrophosphatase